MMMAPMQIDLGNTRAFPERDVLPPPCIIMQCAQPCTCHLCPASMSSVRSPCITTQCSERMSTTCGTTRASSLAWKGNIALLEQAMPASATPTRRGPHAEAAHERRPHTNACLRKARLTYALKQSANNTTRSAAEHATASMTMLARVDVRPCACQHHDFGKSAPSTLMHNPKDCTNFVAKTRGHEDARHSRPLALHSPTCELGLAWHAQSAPP